MFNSTAFFGTLASLLPQTGQTFFSKNFLQFLVSHHSSARNYNGIHQVLEKNFTYWDLVKFIVGYERYINHGDE
jgi:hypothetical protein